MPTRRRDCSDTIAHESRLTKAAARPDRQALRRSRNDDCLASENVHVLFVCLHNAGRSQMSRALFERTAQGRHEARSAGTTPAERIHPEVLEVMRELDVDLSDITPRLLTRDLADWADVLVTMGCGDQCPFVPGVRYVDWELPDPAGRPIAEVRATRDEVARRVQNLVGELDDPPSSPSSPGTSPASRPCTGS